MKARIVYLDREPSSLARRAMMREIVQDLRPARRSVWARLLSALANLLYTLRGIPQ